MSLGIGEIYLMQKYIGSVFLNFNKKMIKFKTFNKNLFNKTRPEVEHAMTSCSFSTVYSGMIFIKIQT